MPTGSPLGPYRGKRDFEATPEPAGAEPGPVDGVEAPRFVVQEHHASSLHWDLRLERDGALASWALPRGLPPHPDRNHLAVRTEDHPLEYLDFDGEIPAGSYGAGTMTIWDRGTYETHKWRENEVMVTLHGKRAQGRYVIFPTGGKNSMIHRMDPPQDAGRQVMPESLAPMLATAGRVPASDEGWSFEVKWDGVRALAHCSGGRLKLRSRSGRDITATYPELRGLAEALGSTEVVLDGEVVAFDGQRTSFERLQQRMNVSDPRRIERLRREVPVAFFAFDVPWFEGRDLTAEPIEARREVLAGLELKGPHWGGSLVTPSSAPLLAIAREQRFEGIIAKRLGSPYRPGRRSPDWVKVKLVRRTSLVIGGWLGGDGGRLGRLGALCVGFYEGGVLHYAGRVGTGFTDKELARVGALLEPLAVADSPFTGRQPPKAAQFVRPALVCEVEYLEWTQTRTLRAPSYKGLRDDLDPADVAWEDVP